MRSCPDSHVVWYISDKWISSSHFGKCSIYLSSLQKCTKTLFTENVRLHVHILWPNFYVSGTKDQFARDDPAFLVLLSLSLLFSSIFYAYALGLSKTGFFTFFLWSVFVDCIAVGVVIATILWWVSNRFLRKVRDQDVEWGYCFDVHLNAFFPMLILLHVIVPILYPSKFFFSTFKIFYTKLIKK